MPSFDATLPPVVPTLMDGVILRMPREAEAEDALAMLRDPEVVRWNGAPRVVDLDSARDWCRRGADWSTASHVTFSAVDAKTERLLGNVSLFHLDADNGTASVGYRTAPWARRRGVASAAVSAAADVAFGAMGLFRVELRHAVPNSASCGVAGCAGFEQEATLRLGVASPDGMRHDEHLHARLRTDPPPG